MRAITSKLEINVNRADIVDPVALMDFAKKHGCAGVVVDPEMFDVFHLNKMKRGYTGALGLLVDHPNGDSTGMHKLASMPENALEADFMDVMFRSNMQMSDYKKEIIFFKNTAADYINQSVEVRPVVDFNRSSDSVNNLLEALGKTSVPRVKTNPKTNYVTTPKHLENIKTIREHTPRPIVLSGNIDLKIIRETFKDIGPTGRYAVSFAQAKKIVKDMIDEPHAIANLVSEDDIVIEEEIKPATLDDLDSIVKRHMLDVLSSIPGATGMKMIKTSSGDGYLEITSTEDKTKSLKSVTINLGDGIVEAKVKFVK